MNHEYESKTTTTLNLNDKNENFSQFLFCHVINEEIDHFINCRWFHIISVSSLCFKGANLHMNQSCVFCRQ